MKTKGPRTLATWVDCPGLAEGRYAHSMRDGCSSCAPWWERIPTCPVHSIRLTPKGFCRTCRTLYDVKTREAAVVVAAPAVRIVDTNLIGGAEVT